jgi:hypothetical protein
MSSAATELERRTAGGSSGCSLPLPECQSALLRDFARRPCEATSWVSDGLAGRHDYKVQVVGPFGMVVSLRVSC